MEDEDIPSHALVQHIQNVIQFGVYIFSQSNIFTCCGIFKWYHLFQVTCPVFNTTKNPPPTYILKPEYLILCFLDFSLIPTPLLYCNSSPDIPPYYSLFLQMFYQHVLFVVNFTMQVYIMSAKKSTLSAYYATFRGIAIDNLYMSFYK